MSPPEPWIPPLRPALYSTSYPLALLQTPLPATGRGGGAVIAVPGMLPICIGFPLAALCFHPALPAAPLHPKRPANCCLHCEPFPDLVTPSG